jgi:hypothetical protein
MELNSIDPNEQPKLHTYLSAVEEADGVEVSKRERALTGFEAMTLTVNDLALALVISLPAAISSGPGVKLPEFHSAEALLLYFATSSSPIERISRARTRIEERRHTQREHAQRRREEQLKEARKVKPAAVNLRTDGIGYDHNSLLGRALPFAAV